MFYVVAAILFVAIRLPIIMFSDAALLSEEYARGAIANQMIHYGFSDWTFLFADDYALGSFFSGLWIAPFFMLFGHTVLSLKIAALFFSLIALMLWIWLFTIAVNLDTGRIMGIILIFSPPALQCSQLTNMGYHTEAVLFIPFAFLLSFHLMNQRVSLLKVLVTGIFFGMIVSYCLTNIPVVILAMCTSLFYFSREHRLKENIFLLFGSILGFAPWVWLKIPNYQGGKLFPTLRASEKTITDILENLYDLFFIHLPSSIVSFIDEPSLGLSLATLTILFCIYVLAFSGWKEGFLYKCFLVYPLLFIGFFLIINPLMPEKQHPVVILKSKRYIVSMVYIFLGIYALAFAQVQKRFLMLRKPFMVFMPISLAVLVLNLWVIIFVHFPVYRTAYGQEPGYLPIMRNYNLGNRYFDNNLKFGSSKRLLRLHSLIRDSGVGARINLQTLHVVGIATGSKLHQSAQLHSAVLEINDFISELDTAERTFFLRGLAWGCFPAVLKLEINLGVLYLGLQEDGWKPFTIGLIDACFRLKNPENLWEVLQHLSDIYKVPVLLPPLEARSALTRYSEQISVLGYRCMVLPGCIREYIDMFKEDPVSLKLLGWWLALRMTSEDDKGWLSLKTGPDYQDSINYIAEGMKALRAEVTFVHLLCDQPLETYKGADYGTAEKQKYLRKISWSPNKPIWPVWTGSKKSIEQCDSILKRK